MSRDHKKEEKRSINNEKIKQAHPCSCTIMTTPKPKLRKDKEVKKGQGLLCNKWKGLNFFILI